MARLKRILVFLLFGGLLGGTFLLAAVFNTAMIWAVWYAFVFVFLLCLLQLLWPLAAVQWQVQRAERPADTPLLLTGTMTNRHWWQWQPQLRAAAADGWGTPATLLGRHRVPVTLHTRLGRGVYSQIKIPVEATDLLGLLSKGRRVKVPVDLVIYPRVPARAVRQLLPTLNLLRAHQLAGLADPYSLKGYRRYIPGDPLNVIDWRVTARAGHMMIRELTPEPTPFIHVVFNRTAANFNEAEWALFFGVQQATRNWTNVWFWWPAPDGGWQHAHELTSRLAAAYVPPATAPAWTPAVNNTLRGATIVVLGQPMASPAAGVRVVPVAVGPDGQLVGGVIERKERASS